jgi:uncharacterized protein (DUF488 family)
MIYTIGHSTQSIEDFYELLLHYNIDCIIDIRSSPYSQHAPQFNRENLKDFLSRKNILYAHFGDEFGARRTDCLCPVIKTGKEVEQVNFEIGITTPLFKKGVERIDKALIQKRKIALMCSEANPLDCHRFSFISRYFHDNGYEVHHILRNKETCTIESKTQKELEQCMIKEYLSKKKPELREVGSSLFDEYSEAEQRCDAYKLKNREIGYINQQEENDIID